MRAKVKIHWQPVFGRVDDKNKSDAISYWKKHGVLVKEEVRKQRAEELVLMAYDTDGNVIATSTAKKVQIKLLDNNWLYQYRCFIDPDHRAIGFDCHLTVESLRLLEEAAATDNDRPVGVITIIENENLYTSKLHKAAVWRAYSMYFIGYDAKGHPIRVYYFKDARI